MIITTQVRQWQSFYGLVMRTKKPHYIYRNGEWFGYSCDNNIILEQGLSIDDLRIIQQAAYEDGYVEPDPPKPPKPPGPRLVYGDNIGIILMPLALGIIAFFVTLLLVRI